MTCVMGILLELRSVLKLRLNVKLEQGFCSSERLREMIEMSS
jgi:hypothetical protein